MKFKLTYKESIVLLITLIVTILLLRRFGVGKYFSLQSLQENSKHFQAWVEASYFTSVILYILIFALIIATTLPFVGPLAMIGGFLYGIVPGTIYALIGATLGSTASFLMVRYLLSNMLRTYYSDKLEKFNVKLKSYGHTYLISLQLLMVVPYFVINALASLAGVSFVTFLWTTVVGSLPSIFIFALAGKQLHAIDSVKDIFKPHVIGVLILLAILAILPMMYRRFRGAPDDQI